MYQEGLKRPYMPSPHIRKGNFGSESGTFLIRMIEISLKEMPEISELGFLIYEGG